MNPNPDEVSSPRRGYKYTLLIIGMASPPAPLSKREGERTEWRVLLCLALTVLLMGAERVERN